MPVLETAYIRGSLAKERENDREKSDTISRVVF